MAELRKRFENTVQAIRDQSFEERWARYWAMVLHALDNAPHTLEFLNRLIIGQEEELAAAQGRPTLEEMLGPERTQLRKEADDEVTRLLKPFFSGDGTTAEREAVANERRRIRSEIHPHTERAEPDSAYETYALVLDYTTAFGVASAVAFKASIGLRQPTPSDQVRREREAPPDGAPQPRVEQPAMAEALERPAPVQPETERSEPVRPETEPPAPALDLHAPQATAPRPEGPAMGPEGPPPRAEPRSPAPPPVEPETRGGRRGLIIAASILLFLTAAAGAGFVLKPEVFDPAFWSAGKPAVTADNTQAAEPADKPADQPAAAPQDKTPEPVPTAAQEPAPAPPPSPLDKFHTEIMNTDVSKCAAPVDLAKTKWADIAAFTECTKAEGVALANTFRFMLSQAGGQWLGGGNWKAPSGPIGEQLTTAWNHINSLRARWAADVKSSVSNYGASYFGFRSHGMTGWRFAAWRCRCNLKGEYQTGDQVNVKPRLFITRPALIGSEEEARLAFSQVGNYFVGPAAQGDKQAVERGLKNANLPHGLPGGLGMARPLQTKEEAEQAWAEVKALHAGVGFEVSELQWAGN